MRLRCTKSNCPPQPIICKPKVLDQNNHWKTSISMEFAGVDWTSHFMQRLHASDPIEACVSDNRCLPRQQSKRFGLRLCAQALRIKSVGGQKLSNLISLQSDLSGLFDVWSILVKGLVCAWDIRGNRPFGYLLIYGCSQDLTDFRSSGVFAPKFRPLPAHVI